MACLVALGQILLKRSASRIVQGKGLVPFILSLLNLPVLAALAAGTAAPLLYVKALGKLELDEAFSFNGLSYLLVLVFSTAMLKEKVNRWQVLGTLLIAAGFILPFIVSAAAEGKLCFP